MTTQADSRALGTPPDGVESPATTATPFTSHTHDLLHVSPSQIRRGDIYKHSGYYRTVSSVIQKDDGGVAVYFRSDGDWLTPPADIPEGVYAVSVWRPKELGSYV